MNLETETASSGVGSSNPRPPLSPDELGPLFPHLEVLECLGRGGMGVVYKARQKSLHRIVALKLLAPERVGDPAFAARFAREAQALARLNHPNIVTVYDFGQVGGFYYLLMEFVDGVNLRHLLRARKLSPEEALAVVPPLCDALQFAHDRGIVHRDIKPENLLLDKNGRIKIVDFGIAKMLETDGAAPVPAKDRSRREEAMAASGAPGTPGYMAPEQKDAPHKVDHRADIYSLGVVFYEMLTGELPSGRLQPPSSRHGNLRIDVRIDEIVLRALEEAPEMRWQTAAEFRTQLEAVGTSHLSSTESAKKGAPLPPTGNARTTRRNALKLAGWAAGATMAVLLLCLAGFLLLSSRQARLESLAAQHRAEAVRQQLLNQGVLKSNGPAAAVTPLLGKDTASSESLYSEGREAARVKMRHAEDELARMTELYDQRIVSQHDLDRARFEVELRRAELAGDARAVARLRLLEAENELARMVELSEGGVVTRQQVSLAEMYVELRRAELNGDAIAAARVRLQQAEMEFARVSELRQRNIVSAHEYERSKETLELRRAELQDLKP